MLSQFLFAVVVDVVTELSGEGVLSEWLYADDDDDCVRQSRDSGICLQNRRWIFNARV